MTTRPLAIVGVDPGRDGALVRLITVGGIPHLSAHRLSKLSREPREVMLKIAAILTEWRQDSIVTEVVLERPFGIMGQGNMVEYGRSFGHLECALCSSHDNVNLVYPAQWQPRLFPKVKDWKAKEQAAYIFPKIFPKSFLGDATHNGIIDAALIAVSRLVELNMFGKFPLINWVEARKPSKRIAK